MTISSVQLDCLTISDITNDTITLAGGTGGTAYYTGSGIGAYSASDTITISNGGSSYTIGGTISTSTTVNIGGAGSGFNWKAPEEFVDAFPDYNRIEKMCKEYPGLKIAYDKFVTTYKLVKDHYDTPEDQRPKP